MPSWQGPWFDAASPWNQGVPTDCPVHADTAPSAGTGMVQGYYIGTDYTSYDVHAFAYQVAQLTAKGDGNPSRDVKWAGPGQQENIVFVPSGQPLITIWKDSPTYKAASFQVPLPFNWTGYNSPWDITTAYYERRTTVVTQGGDLWFLYGVTPPGHPIRDNPSATDTVWHASDVYKDPNGGWLGKYPSWNAGGSGFPPFAGTITPYDILNTPVGGNFGHALGGNVSWAADGSLASHPKWAWPAVNVVYGTHPLSDGRTKGITGIPHGARIFWDPTLTDADFRAMGITKEWQLQIARTLRDFGLISKESVAGQGGAGGLISESIESIAWNISHGYYPAGFQWPWIADGTTDNSDKDTTTYGAALPLAALPTSGSRWKVADWNKVVPGITAPGTSTGGGGGGGGTTTITPVREVLHDNTHTSSASTITLTVASAPAAGHMLVLTNMMNTASFTVSSITDSKGNLWQIDEQATHPSSAVTLLAASTMQGGGTLVGGDTIVLHLSGSYSGSYVSTVHEFSGVVNVVDGTPSSGTATGTSRAAGSVTTTNPNDLIWAAFGVAGADAAFAPGTNYTSFATRSYANSTTATLEFQYELGSVAATFSPSATGSSFPSLGIMVAYRAGTAPTGGGGGGGGTQAFDKEVAHGLGNPVASTYTFAVAAAPAAGDLLVASLNWNDDANTLTSITDSKGNLWSVDNQVGATLTSTSAAVGSTMQNAGTLTTSDTITLHFSGSVARVTVAVHELSGYTNTVDQVGSDPDTTGTTRDAGSVTTLNANDLVWAVFGGGGADTSFTPGSGFTAPAPGFYSQSSSIVEFAYEMVSATGTYHPTGSGTAAFRTCGCVVAYKATVGGAGGTPVSSQLPAASGAAVVGASVSVTSGVWDAPTLRGSPTTGFANTAGTLTIPVPSGVVAGDVLLYQVGVNGPTNLPTTPSGLTLIDSDTLGPSVATYYRVCDGTEPTSYSWTVANSASGTGRAYSGASNSAPINAHSLNRTTASLTATATSVTTSVAKTMLIFASLMATSPETSFGIAAGFGQRVFVSSAGGAAASEESLQMAAGATDPVSAAWSPTANNNYAALIALAPAVTTSPTFAYQWQRDVAGNGVYSNISAATSSTYTPVAADVGNYLRCVVTATNGSGSTPVDSNSLGPVSTSGPVNTVQPSVTGSAVVGSTLTTDHGTWTDAGSPTFTYQWVRDTLGDGVFVPILGATSSTYTLVDADDGCNVKCLVTDTDSVDSTQVDSTRVGPITELPPVNVVAPTIG